MENGSGESILELTELKEGGRRRRNIRGVNNQRGGSTR